MKKTLLLSLIALLFLACETGIKNQKKSDEKVYSGIVDRVNNSTKNYTTAYQKRHQSSSNKIFSTSAQPGFYLQMAVFEKYRPDRSFLKPLDKSRFNYIVLNKYNKDYVLIGAYKSHAEAKNEIASVKSSLGKKTFVVQVLRP